MLTQLGAIPYILHWDLPCGPLNLTENFTKSGVLYKIRAVYIVLLHETISGLYDTTVGQDLLIEGFRRYGYGKYGDKALATEIRFHVVRLVLIYDTKIFIFSKERTSESRKIWP